MPQRDLSKKVVSLLEDRAWRFPNKAEIITDDELFGGNVESADWRSIFVSPIVANEPPKTPDLKDAPASSMSTDMTREEIDAKLEAASLRSDVRFEQLVGELRANNAALVGKIDTASARSLDKWTAAGMLVAAVALIFSLIAFGGDQFGAGKELGGSIAELDAKMDRIEAAQAEAARLAARPNAASPSQPPR